MSFGTMNFEHPNKGDDCSSDQMLELSFRRDCSLGVMKSVTALVIFMGGVVFGLSLAAGMTMKYSSPTEIFFPWTMSTANCDNDCLSFKTFTTPRHLKHSMTDVELFWRASLVPKKVEYPYRRVPKVAFMFLTRGPLPLAPLWDRFFQGHEAYYSIYVHTSRYYKLNVANTSAFYGRQIPSQDAYWGSITLIDAEKRLLANALLDFSNERFVLLSESCIPVFNFSTVYNYLVNSALSYVESYVDSSPRGIRRYSYYMFPDITLKQWRKGSEWFEVNRELATIMVSETKYYYIFKRYCNPSCYPDEHYYPTYLHKFYGSRNSNRTVTWVDWSRLSPHPGSYGEDIDVNFLKSIRNNGTICRYNGKPTSICYLFARKFTPSSLQFLLNISSSIMEY